MNLRTLLILGRVSNLPTVWSNLLAGWALNGGGLEMRPMLILMLGGSLIYTGGMYLNDFCDAPFDAQYCPLRPIPSGQISRRTVGTLASLLLASGLACLFYLNPLTGGLGVTLIAAITIYDLHHKDFLYAPVIMGLCRFLLYPLAASATGFRVDSYVILLGAALCLYVAGITYLARGESRPGKPVRWALIWLILPVPFAALIASKQFFPLSTTLPPLLAFSLALLGWESWLLIPLWRATNRSIGRVVSGLLAGIVLVDALLMVPSGTWIGLWVLPLFPLALLLQRIVPAT